MSPYVLRVTLPKLCFSSENINIYLTQLEGRYDRMECNLWKQKQGENFHFNTIFYMLIFVEYDLSEKQNNFLKKYSCLPWGCHLWQRWFNIIHPNREWTLLNGNEIISAYPEVRWSNYSGGTRAPLRALQLTTVINRLEHPTSQEWLRVNKFFTTEQIVK